MEHKYIETEITIEEAPKELQLAINEKLDRYKVLAILRVVSFPYKDTGRESITYKAYLLYGNLMTLLTKHDFLDEVREDSMTAGDITKMFGYWNNLYGK